MLPDNLAFFTGLAAFFIGLGKAGLSALAGLTTPILIIPLPDPRTAVGLGAVIFFLGDIGAVAYYLRSARPAILLQVLPIAALGMFFAFIVGKMIPTGPYMLCITALSAVAFILLLHSEQQKKKSAAKDVAPDSPISQASQASQASQTLQAPSNSRALQFLLLSSGFVAGLTTVLGNVSGIFMTLYLSAKKLPKHGFVATMAVFYLLINGSKLIVYYFYWHNLDPAMLAGLLPHSLWILSALILGLLIGVFVIHKMTEKIFSLFVVLASLAAFLLLLWRTIEYFTG